MSGLNNSIHNPGTGSGSGLNANENANVNANANANANPTPNPNPSQDPNQDVALLREQIAYLMDRLNQGTPTAAVIQPPKPETFGGTKGENVETWLFQVKQYLELCRIEDNKMQIRMAAAFFKETAAIWWRNRLASTPDLGGLTTWNEFQTALAEQFRPVNASKLARDRLARLRQTHSVQAYTHAFRSVALEIPQMTEEEKLDKFLRGLKDETRVPVELRGPTTMEEAATFAERVDAIIHRNVTYKPRYTPADSSGPIPMEIDTIRTKLSDAESRKASKNRVVASSAGKSVTWHATARKRRNE